MADTPREKKQIIRKEPRTTESLSYSHEYDDAGTSRQISLSMTFRVDSTTEIEALLDMLDEAKVDLEKALKKAEKKDA